MGAPLAPWTEERLASLKKQWDAGYSCSQIAAELGGTSRNAVIGKVHRLGLPGRPVKAKECTKFRAPRSAPKVPRIRIMTGHVRPAPLMKREELELRCVAIAPRGLSLFDLEPNDCRYPYGDRDVTFCGHPKSGDSSYCSAHDRLTRVVTRPKLSPAERLQRQREYMASYRASKRIPLEAAE